MHQTKYIWGILAIVLLLVLLGSPLPANAQRRDGNSITTAANFTPPQNRVKTYPFERVWALILKHHAARSSHFSPEIIACLMWEESGFRLVENPGSRALGFGQIMPATLRGVNQRFKTKFTRTDILTSPDASVEATILALELAYSWKQNKVAALVAYAGGFQNYQIVAKWITAEPKMIQARIADPSGAVLVSTSAGRQFVDALHLCSQPGYHPRMIFE